MGVGFGALPVKDPKTGTGGVKIPGVGVAFGGMRSHCGTLQHCGSLGSATNVHPAGRLS